MAYAVRFQLFLAAVLLAAAVSVDAGPPRYSPPNPTDPRYRIDCTASAYFDMNGVRGSLHFYQPYLGAPVEIHIDLDGIDQYTETFPWHVHTWPVPYSLLRDFPCTAGEVGPHYDPAGASFNNPDYDAECAANASFCEVGDLSGKLGNLRSGSVYYEDPLLSLFGSRTIVGRSIVIHRQDGQRWICANIEYSGVTKDAIRYAFDQPGPLQGDVIIRRIEGRTDASINVELYRIDGGPAGTFNHSWNLRVGRAVDGNCSTLDHIYGTNTYADEYQWIRDRCDDYLRQRECFIGDLGSKCGPLTIFPDGRIRTFCTDSQIGSIPWSSITPLTLAIKEAEGSEVILDCIDGQLVQPECSYVYFRDKKIFGNIFFFQMDPHDRTFVRAYVTGLRRRAAYFEIHEDPVPDDGSCDSLGPVFDIPRGDRLYPDGISSGAGAIESGNTVPIGNLEPKLTRLRGRQNYIKTDSSNYIPLFGPYNITGHSIVLVDRSGERLACATIQQYKPFPGNLVSSILGYRY